MRYYLLFFLTFIFINPLSAQKQKADSLYMVQHYKDAIEIYESLLAEGVHEDVYYNLGNCYFRMNRLPAAVLNYERALKLNPDHVDAKHNLELCRAQIGVYEDVADEFFFTTLIKRCVLSKNANQWMWWAIVAMLLLTFTWICYCLLSSVKLRKFSFFSAIICLSMTFVFNIFAAQSKQYYYEKNRVVALKDIEIYEAPNINSRTLGKLTPAATYHTDAQQDTSWIRLNFADGTVGWCNKSGVEAI